MTAVYTIPILFVNPTLVFLLQNAVIYLSNMPKEILSGLNIDVAQKSNASQTFIDTLTPILSPKHLKRRTRGVIHRLDAMDGLTIEEKNMLFCIAVWAENPKLKGKIPQAIGITRDMIGFYLTIVSEDQRLADRYTELTELTESTESPEPQEQPPAPEPLVPSARQDTPISSMRSMAAKNLWQDEDYRQKVIRALEQRKNDPEFIEKMRAISKGRPSPMEGKTHSPETARKISASTQNNWNTIHGIEPNDPLAKRTELFTEWQQLTALLGHCPSLREITRLKREGKTRFSVTMYKQEFGQGSFTRAKEALATITKTKEQLSAKSHKFSASRFGKDERSMWQYTVEHNLQHTMVQAGLITEEQLELIRQYYEENIIGENLSEEIFERFTIAVANTA